MTFDSSLKTLKQAEKTLTQTRKAVESARAEAEAHQKVLAELQDRKSLEIRKAGQSGKLPNLTEINASINAAKGKLTEAESILLPLEQSEAEAVRALVTTEKQAQDALRDAWDHEADRIREQFIQLAGPMLKSYWTARFHGHNPVAMFSLLRTPGGLLSELDAAAQDAQAVFDNGIPEQVESALLTHEERTAGTFHPALAI